MWIVIPIIIPENPNDSPWKHVCNMGTLLWVSIFPWLNNIPNITYTSNSWSNYSGYSRGKNQSNSESTNSTSHNTIRPEVAGLVLFRTFGIFLVLLFFFPVFFAFTAILPASLHLSLFLPPATPIFMIPWTIREEATATLETAQPVQWRVILSDRKRQAEDRVRSHSYFARKQFWKRKHETLCLKQGARTSNWWKIDDHTTAARGFGGPTNIHTEPPWMSRNARI